MAHGSFVATEMNKTLCPRCGSQRQGVFYSSAAIVAYHTGYLRAIGAPTLGRRDQKGMTTNGDWGNKPCLEIKHQIVKTATPSYGLIGALLAPIPRRRRESPAISS
ncbi:hypothetical protein ES708_20117 [subsurface metagenome]